MNIVLIEFNSHHDECLYSQVAFLKSISSNKVFLVSNYRLKNRISYLDEFENVLFLRSNQWGIGHLKILNFLYKNKINKVVFNTVSHKSVNHLLRICSRDKRAYYGIIHDLKQLKNKRYNYTYGMINSFLLLNDYLLKNIDSYSPSEETRFETFYPVFFPENKEIELTKSKDEIWVSIPGKMELKRRDYLALLNAFKKKKLDKKIKIIFLGNSNVSIRKEFESFDVHNNCVFWDGYVDNDIFHTYLLKSDYVLPLIHGGHESCNTYRNKISGSFNLAFSYHIPMIIDSFFREFEDFKKTAVFYHQEDDLIDVLNNLTTPTDKYVDEKWTFEYQRNKFISFINK